MAIEYAQRDVRCVLPVAVALVAAGPTWQKRLLLWAAASICATRTSQLHTLATRYDNPLQMDLTLYAL